jgi:biopolymer transport protein ExbB
MELADRILEYIRQGGWIMLPLAAVSFVMWVLILERVIVLGRLTSRDLDIPGAVAALRAGRLPGSRRGLRARLVGQYLRERTGLPDLDREILRLCARRLQPELQRSHTAIGVLVVVAPLLGLLGTVLGMIRTFDVIALFGTGNAKALAGGVSVALITTQTGLVVAIPGLLSNAALSRQAERLDRRLVEIRTILERHLGAGRTNEE